MHAPPPVLSVRDGSKVYGGTRALDRVDFEAHAGEIHALVGENGAGKSTLGRILSGATSLTEGTLLVDRVTARFRSPADGLRAGVAMVHQETSFVPAMTVAQNLQLGREPVFSSAWDTNGKARRVLDALGFDIDPRVPVETLSTAKRQMVEIARAVSLSARAIIFDEPTASLTPAEGEHLFRLVHVLRGRGVAVVLVTHALDDALRTADRVTVLRDGRRVHTCLARETTRPEIVRWMVGRDIPSHSRLRADVAVSSRSWSRPLLEVDGIWMGNSVRGMSFVVHAGEIVGLAGLVGSGRTEIAKVVSDALDRDPHSGGTIRVRGKAVRYATPAQAVHDGVVYVTEDRKLDGLFETMTAGNNIAVGVLASRAGWRLFYPKHAAERIAGEWIDRLSVAPRRRDLAVVGYSGGNQQKVVIAKALVQDPDVVFFDEPTRGVDVGAIPLIHDAIRRAAGQGRAVVVISSYLPEILSLSDRILVVRAGRIVQELNADTATEHEIMAAAAH